MRELVLLLLCGAVVSAVLATRVSADPVSVDWTNTAPPGLPNASQALLCAGPSCSLAQTDCAPGARCTTAHDLPPGEYENAYLMLAAIAEGWTWSIPVPGTLVVEPAEPSSSCRADFDGNGVVTTVDVSVAIGEFWNGCGD